MISNEALKMEIAFKEIMNKKFKFYFFVRNTIDNG